MAPTGVVPEARKREQSGRQRSRRGGRKEQQQRGERDLRTVSPSYSQEKQVTCVYDGYHRELCPLIRGHSKGEEKALVFQFAGETSKGKLPPGGAWKCMFLASVREARLRDGPWREARQADACAS